MEYLHYICHSIGCQPLDMPPAPLRCRRGPLLILLHQGILCGWGLMSKASCFSVVAWEGRSGLRLSVTLRKIAQCAKFACLTVRGTRCTHLTAMADHVKVKRIVDGLRDECLK